MRVVFLHRELEVGGGERNTINLALALQQRGHHVRFLVSRHNKKLSYAESHDFDVTVTGNFLAYEYFFGHYFRALWLGIWLCFFSNWDYDLVYVCQHPYSIPFIKWFGKEKAPVVLHCNFPDKLYRNPNGVDTKLFGWFWDTFEEWSTKKADMAIVNSNFTEKTFLDVYKSFPPDKLRRLYPCMHESQQANPVKSVPTDLPESIVPVNRAQSFFLSLNRYDFLKRTDLSIRALANLKTRMREEDFDRIHLVIAGALNTERPSSRDCHNSLVKLTKHLGVNDHVTLLCTMESDTKWTLLSNCLALLFTSINEDFGIVPLEAMSCSRPVVAVQSGGPMETVVHGKTGLLAEPGDEEGYANNMFTLVQNRELADNLGMEGKKRVNELFTFQQFAQSFDSIICEVMG